MNSKVDRITFSIMVSVAESIRAGVSKFKHWLTRRVLNLHRDKNRWREADKYGKILSDLKQDGNVAVRGIGNPAH